MDVGILAPVLGVVLAVIVVLLLWRVMRVRARSAARTRTPALSESEAEFLDSSHIISGGTTSTDPRRKGAGKAAPPVDRIP